jgi:hypothetical protein
MLVIVHIDRDSVHPGDDLESHAAKVEIDSESDIGSMLKDLQSRYLPSIAGGVATWIVSCSGDGPNPVGVLAQQWQEPRLRVPLETPITQVLGCGRLSVSFEYWCQKDPALVFEKIFAGKKPPPKW